MYNCLDTFKYHVFAPMGKFQLELIYLYGTTVENKGKLILIVWMTVGLNDFLNVFLLKNVFHVISCRQEFVSLQINRKSKLWLKAPTGAIPVN